jgi:hypothetical protein
MLLPGLLLLAFQKLPSTPQRGHNFQPDHLKDDHSGMSGFATSPAITTGIFDYANIPSIRICDQNAFRRSSAADELVLTNFPELRYWKAFSVPPKPGPSFNSQLSISTSPFHDEPLQYYTRGAEHPS